MSVWLIPPHRLGILQKDGRVYYTCKLSVRQTAHVLEDVGCKRVALSRPGIVSEIEIKHKFPGGVSVAYMLEDGRVISDESLIFPTQLDAMAEMVRRNRV